jgi:hypothetical protein
MFSQENEVTISGVVYDKSMNNETLIGVNVFIKNKPGVGTTTDADGKFSIKANIGEVISFVYIGYGDIQYKVTKKESDVKLYMEPSSEQIEEAVVVAMGSSVKLV